MVVEKLLLETYDSYKKQGLVDDRSNLGRFGSMKFLKSIILIAAATGDKVFPKLFGIYNERMEKIGRPLREDEAFTEVERYQSLEAYLTSEAKERGIDTLQLAEGFLAQGRLEGIFRFDNLEVSIYSPDFENIVDERDVQKDLKLKHPNLHHENFSVGSPDLGYGYDSSLNNIFIYAP